MVRIRLKRVGGKKHPFYRIVVADQRAARDGAFIDQVGTYDPFPDPPEIKIDEEKVAKWMKNGAQPSESVISLFRSAGIFPKLTNGASADVAEKPASKAAPKTAATATAVAEVPEKATAEVADEASEKDATKTPEKDATKATTEVADETSDKDAKETAEKDATKATAEVADETSEKDAKEESSGD